MRPFEEIFLGVGADILQFVSSVLTVHPDSAIRNMKNRLKATAKEIRTAGTPTQIKKLKMELERLNSINVNDIDMKAYGEPMIIHFGTEDKQGYTLVQLIETSNIAAHFVEETSTAYFDVFSCKPFDPLVVIRLVKEYFGATIVNHMFLNRDAKIETQEIEFKEFWNKYY